MMNSLPVCLLVSGGLGLTLLKHIALKWLCKTCCSQSEYRQLGIFFIYLNCGI